MILLDTFKTVSRGTAQEGAILVRGSIVEKVPTETVAVDRNYFCLARLLLIGLILLSGASCGYEQPEYIDCYGVCTESIITLFHPE